VFKDGVAYVLELVRVGIVALCRACSVRHFATNFTLRKNGDNEKAFNSTIPQIFFSLQNMGCFVRRKKKTLLIAKGRCKRIAFAKDHLRKAMLPPLLISGN